MRKYIPILIVMICWAGIGLARADVNTGVNTDVNLTQDFSNHGNKSINYGTMLQGTMISRLDPTLVNAAQPYYVDLNWQFFATPYKYLDQAVMAGMVKNSVDKNLTPEPCFWGRVKIDANTVVEFLQEKKAPGTNAKIRRIGEVPIISKPFAAPNAVVAAAAQTALLEADSQAVDAKPVKKLYIHIKQHINPIAMTSGHGMGIGGNGNVAFNPFSVAMQSVLGVMGNINKGATQSEMLHRRFIFADVYDIDDDAFILSTPPPERAPQLEAVERDIQSGKPQLAVFVAKYDSEFLYDSVEGVTWATGQKAKMAEAAKKIDDLKKAGALANKKVMIYVNRSPENSTNYNAQLGSTTAYEFGGELGARLKQWYGWTADEINGTLVLNTTSELLQISNTLQGNRLVWVSVGDDVFSAMPL